jgi:hypothetical protein
MTSFQELPPKQRVAMLEAEERREVIQMAMVNLIMRSGNNGDGSFEHAEELCSNVRDMGYEPPSPMEMFDLMPTQAEELRYRGRQQAGMIDADPELIRLQEAAEASDSDVKMMSQAIWQVLAPARNAVRRREPLERRVLEYSIELVEDVLNERLATLMEEAMRRWAALDSAVDRKLEAASAESAG